MIADMDMPRVKKIVLVGASFKTQNMGVGALTAGTIKCIIQKYGDAEISMLDFVGEDDIQLVTVGEDAIPINLIRMRFSKKLFQKNNVALLLMMSMLDRALPKQIAKKSISSRNHCLRSLREADIVCSISGGDGFSDIYGMKNFFYVSLPQMLALLSGARLVLMPQTVGPFQGKISQMIAKYILNRADIVYSRDVDGIKKLEEFIGSNDGKLRQSYDVAFALDPKEPTGFKDIGLHDGELGLNVGLNVSGLLFNDKNIFNMSTFTNQYKELIYELIHYIIEIKQANVILIPHVMGDLEIFESDVTACRNIIKKLEKIYPQKISIAGVGCDQNEIKYIIGECDFFIGSRMHACIAALSQNIPSVGIAYSDKFRDVFETINAGDLAVDYRHSGKQKIIDTIGNAIDRRQELSTDLEERMKEVRKSVLDIFYKI